jgi:hypothetical protein
MIDEFLKYFLQGGWGVASVLAAAVVFLFKRLERVQELRVAEFTESMQQQTMLLQAMKTILDTNTPLLHQILQLLQEERRKR